MVTIFSFVSGVVMSPIKFIQWVVPSILDRFTSTLSAVRQFAHGILKSSQSIFKRILFNPITIAVLIGGLLYFFGPKLFGWLTDKIMAVKGQIIPILKGFFGKVWSFIKGAWNVLSYVGKFLFNAIEYVTRPEGWIAQTVVRTIKLLLAVKKWIGKMMKAAGKDSIDIFCRFLAGDWIGVAIHTIAGACVKFWRWLRDTPVFRLLLGILKGVIQIIGFIAKSGTLLMRSMINATWELAKGNFGGIVSAFTKPYKDWWKSMKDLFKMFSFKKAEEPVEYVPEDEDPSARNA